ncbi:hypothetical protein QQS21_009794 [Conoideocrella luteorostrata]|uniref:Uncharacterized protein n=1 Tax=Conoideocrella luteorostrata TaxID=1105319 RepID=A0AAJ0CJ03_9HYPO|nr:hypothetical protein QQS21_009794 [Conoideocrella luteorostrata]
MDEDGPQILRPVPRRPFNLNLTGATPPDDDPADQVGPSQTSFQSGLDLSSPRFLNANFERTESSSSLTRPQSFMNLTSSTLMGIYSEAASHTRGKFFNDNEEPDTPWGTGARTPIRRPSVDEATYELMRGRSHVPKRQSSFGHYGNADTSLSYSTAESIVSLTLRGTLLFALGLGYGALVTRLHSDQDHLPLISDESILKPGNNWKFLVCWGVAGVALGSLLPWFDTVWDDVFGSDVENDASDKDAGPGTDWALVMRAIGAFVAKTRLGFNPPGIRDIGLSEPTAVVADRSQ